MHRPTRLHTITLPTPNLISRSPLRLRFGVVLLALALSVFALSPAALAVDPPPDGGYPGQNTAEGDGALQNVTPNTDPQRGLGNTAIGFNALYSNTTGNGNTANGSNALLHNTIGGGNAAIGEGALFDNTFGSYNTAIGEGALFHNTTGSYNTAIGSEILFINAGTQNTGTGFHALVGNYTGNYNTANGSNALNHNSTGSNNTATGAFALSGSSNVVATDNSGNNNTATGVNALSGNSKGNNNTATGFKALLSNTTGNGNTANGVQALNNNTTGTNNTAMGSVALFKTNTGTFNTACGDSTLYGNTTGSFNTAVGFNAGSRLTTGGSNVDIANAGVAGESNTIRIGAVGTHTNTFIAGINGVTVAAGIGVVIDANGHLGTVTSSARFKKAIKPMDKASEAILALQPVTFRYKNELDPNGIPQFGLIAEQVEKINPDLVARDEDGKVMTVRYEAVNAMLLNEFLKEHRKVAEQESTIAELKSAVAKQQATNAQQQQQIEALAAGLQKVSAVVELNRAVTQVADNVED